LVVEGELAEEFAGGVPQRGGPPLTTSNVRRHLRHAMSLAGITPHMFRRTVAMAIHEQVFSKEEGSGG